MIELARNRMMMGGSAPLPTWLTKACEEYGLPVNNMVTIWRNFPEIQYVFEPNIEGKYMYLYSPRENAFIDLGIKISFPSDTIICKGQVFKFGYYRVDDRTYFCVSNRNTKWCVNLFLSGWYGVYSISPYPNTVTISNGNIVFVNANRQSYFSQHFPESGTTGQNIYLFTWNGFKESVSSMIQLFWHKTRNIFLVPYINPSDNKYCMIDVINMRIYPNNGTVDFEIRYI